MPRANWRNQQGDFKKVGAIRPDALDS